MFGRRRREREEFEKEQRRIREEQLKQEQEKQHAELDKSVDKKVKEFSANQKVDKAVKKLCERIWPPVKSYIYYLIRDGRDCAFRYYYPPLGHGVAEWFNLGVIIYSKEIVLVLDKSTVYNSSKIKLSDYDIATINDRNSQRALASVIANYIVERMSKEYNITGITQHKKTISIESYANHSDGETRYYIPDDRWYDNSSDIDAYAIVICFPKQPAPVGHIVL